MTSLGVNIDHIAFVREARQTNEPDPVRLALLAEIGGADGITVHLREDRRHIQDRDLKLLKATINTRLNLEMASTSEMVQIAIEIQPDLVTLVPENRQEITTEGGLNVEGNEQNLKASIRMLQEKNIPVSLFIDPNKRQIEASKRVEATFVELHTGDYAEASIDEQPKELRKLQEATIQARSIDLRVNAGHGLTYQNVEPVAAIEGIEELNIGHTIIARSIATGLKDAVQEMKRIISSPRIESQFIQNL